MLFDEDIFEKISEFTEVIPPLGGEIISEDGVVITWDDQPLANLLTFSRLRLIEPRVLERVVPITTVYHIESDLPFDPAITITLPIRANIPEGVSMESVGVVRYEGNKFVRLSGSSIIDRTHVRFETSTFSVFTGAIILPEGAPANEMIRALYPVTLKSFAYDRPILTGRYN